MFRFLIVSMFLVSSSISLAVTKDQRVNIHFQVSKNLQKKVIESKELLKSKDFQTIPDTMKPHITVYMSLFAKDKLVKIKEKLSAMCDRKPIPAVTTGWSLTKDRWFFLDIEKTKEIMNFHNKIVSALAPMRADSANVIPKYVKEIYPERIPTMKKIGSVYAGPYFGPHFSLLTWKHSDGAKKFMDENPRVSPVTGSLTGLAVAVANDDGQFQKAIWNCNFEKK